MKFKIQYLWLVTIFTKFVYVFIMYSRSPEAFTKAILGPITSLEHFVFLGLGLLMCVFGFVLSKQLANPSSFVNKIYQKQFYNRKNNPPIILHLINLGLIENCALFGLMGFFLEPSLSYSIIQFSLWLIGWIICFPKEKNLNLDVS